LGFDGGSQARPRKCNVLAQTTLLQQQKQGESKMFRLRQVHQRQEQSKNTNTLSAYQRLLPLPELLPLELLHKKNESIQAFADQD
jgi:hypothetical protein